MVILNCTCSLEITQVHLKLDGINLTLYGSDHLGISLPIYTIMLLAMLGMQYFSNEKNYRGATGAELPETITQEDRAGYLMLVQTLSIINIHKEFSIY